MANKNVLIKKFIIDGAKLHFPINFLEEVVEKYTFDEIKDTDTNHTTIFTKNIGINASSLVQLSNITTFSPTGADAAGDLYHECVHAMLDIKKGSAPYQDFIKKGTAYYINAPLKDGTYSSDVDTLFTEAISEYVDQRIAFWFLTYVEIINIIKATNARKNPAILDKRLIKAVKEYNKEMAKKVFGYIKKREHIYSLSSDQVWTIKPLTPEMKKFIDQTFLEDKISDSFADNALFTGLLKEAGIAIPNQEKMRHTVVPEKAQIRATPRRSTTNRWRPLQSSGVRATEFQSGISSLNEFWQDLPSEKQIWQEIASQKNTGFHEIFGSIFKEQLARKRQMREQQVQQPLKFRSPIDPFREQRARERRTIEQRMSDEHIREQQRESEQRARDHRLQEQQNSWRQMNKEQRRKQLQDQQLIEQREQQLREQQLKEQQRIEQRRRQQQQSELKAQNQLRLSRPQNNAAFNRYQPPLRHGTNYRGGMFDGFFKPSTPPAPKSGDYLRRTGASTPWERKGWDL